MEFMAFLRGVSPVSLRGTPPLTPGSAALPLPGGNGFTEAAFGFDGQPRDVAMRMKPGRSAPKKLVQEVQHQLDDAVDDSFPASDPVSFLQPSPVKRGDQELPTVKVNDRSPTSRTGARPHGK